MGDSQEIIAAIDVGTTKICTVVAKKKEERWDLVAFGAAKSEGLRKGSVVDIDKTVEAIKQSLAKARSVARIPIEEAIVSIAGGQIYSFNHSVMVTARGPEVTQRDINRALNMAHTVSLPSDRRILHVIPQYYKLDDIDHIRNPLGMAGQKLTMNLHVVTGPNTLLQNLTKCVNLAGVQVQDLVLQPLASSASVLTEEEKEVGVTLIDIGGGTTDVVVWQRGVPVYSKILPIGGSHFSHDLMMALHIPHAEAEKIKKECGHVLPEAIEEKAYLKWESDEGKKEIPIRFIAKILGLRAEELLLTIKTPLEERKLHQGPMKYVLTGGGALLTGLDKLASYIFERSVRVGLPMWGATKETIPNPQLSTVVGMMNVIYQQQKEESFRKKRRQWDLMKKLNQSLKSVFKEMF